MAELMEKYDDWVMKTTNAKAKLNQRSERNQQVRKKLDELLITKQNIAAEMEEREIYGNMKMDAVV